MGLKEVAEDIKKQLEEANKREEKELEEVVEQPKEEPKVEEAPKEEVKAEEAKSDEAKAEVKADKTNADFAKERREKASREKKLRDDLDAANARIAELSKPKDEPVRTKVEAEPDKAEDPTAWSEWNSKQTDERIAKAEERVAKVEKLTATEQARKYQEEMRKSAEYELERFEASAKTQEPDFDDVKKYYIHQLAYSIKTLNPAISDAQLIKSIDDMIIYKAKQKLDEGYENPALAMYDEVKGNGYKAPVKEEKADELKPDLNRVAKNRDRNAGMAGAGGGNGRGEVTKKYAATEMTTAEWAKMPKEERQRIMRSA